MVFWMLSCTPAVESLDVVLADKEQHGPFQLVRLSGSPYDMGVQHGTLLLEEYDV